MLSNCIYNGLRISNRYKRVSRKPEKWLERPTSEWISTPVEPKIINDILFHHAQDKLLKETDNKGGGGMEKYMLRGKLVEVGTGRGFVGYKGTKGTKNYRRKAYKNSDGVPQSSMSIAAKDLEQFVWGYIQTAIDDPEAFFELYKKNSAKGQSVERLSAELQVTEAAFSKANQRLEKIRDMLTNERITDAQYDEDRMRLEEHRDEAFAKKLRLENDIRANSQFLVAQEQVRRFSEQFKKVKEFTYEDKMRVVDVLVEKVEVVDEKAKRRVRTVFHFDPAAIMEKMPKGRTVSCLVDAKNSTYLPPKGEKVVGRVGFEPTANALKGHCSTS